MQSEYVSAVHPLQLYGVTFLGSTGTVGMIAVDGDAHTIEVKALLVGSGYWNPHTE